MPSMVMVYDELSRDAQWILVTARRMCDTYKPGGCHGCPMYRRAGLDGCLLDKLSFSTLDAIERLIIEWGLREEESHGGCENG